MDIWVGVIAIRAVDFGKSITIIIAQTSSKNILHIKRHAPFVHIAVTVVVNTIAEVFG